MKRLETRTPENEAVAHHYRRTSIDRFGTVAMIALLACSLVLFARLLASDLLAGKLVLALAAVLLAVNAVSVIVQIPLRRNKIGKLICGVFSVLLAAVMLWGMSGVSSAQAALARITGKLVETDVVAVIVTVDDPAQDVADTAGYTFGYAQRMDNANTEALLQHLNETLGTVETRASESLTALVDDLYDGKVGAILLNKGYIPLLEEKEDYADFSKRTRILYENTTTHEITPPDVEGNVTEPFIVYLSGTDARHGDLTARSRSDTNILAVVNPTTHQVLLLNTPRDYYVPLHMNGELDKLTHAGIYGIEESMRTLDDLYGTSTPYYVRVNFIGLIDIVDALDGIDVISPKEFTTNAMEMPNENGSGYSDQAFHFNEGKIHLNGREALAFSRERYAFWDGDNQRGKNQMTVIKGIVKKAASPAIVSNLPGFMKAVSNSFITNLSYKDMTKLVKLFQKGGTDWKVTTYAVTQGPGDTTQYTYSYGYAWVMPPDYDSIATAKELIRQVLEGEVPSAPDADSSN